MAMLETQLPALLQLNCPNSCHLMWPKKKPKPHAFKQEHQLYSTSEIFSFSQAYCTGVSIYP